MRIARDWALSSDGFQWILHRRRRQQNRRCWRPVCFVRSTREALERCMREKGVPNEDARRLMKGLPATFDSWVHRISERGAIP
jgi:hypothetical protein